MEKGTKKIMGIDAPLWAIVASFGIAIFLSTACNSGNNFSHTLDGNTEPDAEAVTDNAIDAGVGEGDSATNDVDSEMDEDGGVPSDDCNTTQECKNKYGADAIDCVNSQSNQSWCKCAGGWRCDSVDSPDAGNDAGDAGNDITDTETNSDADADTDEDSDTGNDGDTQEDCDDTPGEIVVHAYVADYTTIFPNPERGWHNRRDIDGRGGDDDRNFSDVRAAGNTLVHSYLRLDDFADKDELSQSFLNDLQDALNAIRTYGLKLVLRPAYVWNSSPSVPEDRILGHIEQIDSVLSANADVLMHLEAGYLGKWGEWHSGLHTSLSDQSEAATRYRIVKRILDTTPDTIPVAIRYPMSLKEILDYQNLLGSPPVGSQSLTQVDRDRLGHHNDCFLYNENDRGTYARGGLWFGSFSLEEQKQYAFDLIASYGGNKIMGGETCDGMERFNDTQTDMAAANWTEINVNFWKNFILAWKDQNLPAQGNDPAETTYARLSRKMGYRLRLSDATFQTKASAGQDFTFSANLSNDGYASVIKKRPIFLVFVGNSNRYNIELNNVDVRTWVSGDVILQKQKVKLPSEMQSGKYTLALWLPDASANLQHRPEYSIRFANEGIWDAANGYNVLSDTVVIQ